MSNEQKNDRQDPADVKKVDTATETEKQPDPKGEVKTVEVAPEDPAVEEGPSGGTLIGGQTYDVDPTTGHRLRS